MTAQITKVTAQCPCIDPAKLSACDREPIHTPGQIQAHGVLVVTGQRTNQISHVSANFEHMSGLSPKQVLGAEMRDVFGESVSTAIASLHETGAPVSSIVIHLDSDWRFPDPSRTPAQCGSLKPPGSAPNSEPFVTPCHPHVAHGDGGSAPAAALRPRTIAAHRHLGRIFLEIERGDGPAGKEYNLADAQDLLASLRDCTTVEDLCQIAACKVRRLTAYDRVLVYRFDPEGNGSVVAEDKLDSLEPFLGLCYPATDIPRQARQLYVQQRVRAIPNIDYKPVGMLTASEGNDPALVDMSYCALRAVSPVHLEYCRNMGVRATLTASLVVDEVLWGMIVCHHGRSRIASVNLRSLLEVFSQQLSFMIKQTDEACLLADKLRRYGDLARFPFAIEANESLAARLTKNGRALLSLVGAAGALVRLGGQDDLIGQTPELADAIAIVDALRSRNLGDTIFTHDAGMLGGVAETCAELASGVLVLPLLNTPNDLVAFFRPELVRSVHWAGDPTKSVNPYDSSVRLAPRKSFKEWCEIMRGQSAPWSEADLQTGQELRRTIADVLLRQVEAKLAHLSAYDPLTALANRRTIKSLLARVHSERTHARVAMLFFDLDRFKSVNDTWGHGVGDQVLIQAAERLRQLTPEGATPGRLGGDEFVVLWPGASQAEAEGLGKSLAHSLSEPFIFDFHHYHITASVGVACRESDDVEPLLREADEAMYAAKRNGGGQIVVFEPALHARIASDAILEQDLFEAIEHSQLEVHYQPIVKVPSRRISGFEALVRWCHPIRGWISPSDFILRAEANGLIIPLGAFVFATAVRQIAKWQVRNETLTMSINVSGRQLKEASFTTYAIDILTDAQVSPGSICIEVTESTMADAAAVRELHKLREAGCKVAVDDFGTGYSSLSYLQRLPVDCTKIDKSFVQQTDSDGRAGAFLACIVALSHTLELKTIAEGCETEAQWQALSAAGCDSVQGWLVSKALPASEIDALLAGQV